MSRKVFDEVAKIVKGAPADTGQMYLNHFYMSAATLDDTLDFIKEGRQGLKWRDDDSFLDEKLRENREEQERIGRRLTMLNIERLAILSRRK